MSKNNKKNKTICFTSDFSSHAIRDLSDIPRHAPSSSNCNDITSAMAGFEVRWARSGFSKSWVFLELTTGLFLIRSELWFLRLGVAWFWLWPLSNIWQIRFSGGSHVFELLQFRYGFLVIPTWKLGSSQRFKDTNRMEINRAEPKQTWAWKATSLSNVWGLTVREWAPRCRYGVNMSCGNIKNWLWLWLIYIYTYISTILQSSLSHEFLPDPGCFFSHGRPAVQFDGFMLHDCNMWRLQDLFLVEMNNVDPHFAPNLDMTFLHQSNSFVVYKISTYIIMFYHLHCIHGEFTAASTLTISDPVCPAKCRDPEIQPIQVPPLSLRKDTEISV